MHPKGRDPADPESQEEDLEDPHWMFPTSQPDTVEEPEESDVIDLVENSSYEEEDLEEAKEEIIYISPFIECCLHNFWNCNSIPYCILASKKSLGMR